MYSKMSQWEHVLPMRIRGLRGNSIHLLLSLRGWPVPLWPASWSLSFLPDLHLNCITPALQHIAPGRGWALDSWGKTSNGSHLSYTLKACRFPSEPLFKLEKCGSAIVRVQRGWFGNGTHTFILSYKGPIYHLQSESVILGWNRRTLKNPIRPGENMWKCRTDSGTVRSNSVCDTKEISYPKHKQPLGRFMLVFLSFAQTIWG